MLNKSFVSLLVLLSNFFAIATPLPSLASTPEPILRLAGGSLGNNPSSGVSLSSDAHFIAFESYATNFNGAGSGLVKDIYIKNRISGDITRCSIGINGQFANRSSSDPYVTPDGRFVVFTSSASNLVENDTNNHDDIFLYDKNTGQLTRENISTSGVEANARSFFPSISADGRYIVFVSEASNLVANDTAKSWDVFLRDRISETTIRVSKNMQGNTPSQGCYNPQISADGSTIVFHSRASDLYAADYNNNHDVFVYDRPSGSLFPIRNSSGQFGNGLTYDASVSANGDVVAFSSSANNLVSGPDVGGNVDVFVWHRSTGNIKRISRTPLNPDPTGNSFSAVISGDGKMISFATRSSSLFSGLGDYSGIVLSGIDHPFPVPAFQVVSGSELTGDVFFPTIDPTGNWVAYSTEADNIFIGDTNYVSDAVLSSTNVDFCPNDPLKILPQQCGCGVPETDTDYDGTPDCVDICPTNPYKNTEGICGCGYQDTDQDYNGAIDCLGFYGNNAELLNAVSAPPPQLIVKKKKVLAKLPYFLTNADSLTFSLKKGKKTVKLVQHKNLSAKFKKLTKGKYSVTYRWKSPYGIRVSLPAKFKIKK